MILDLTGRGGLSKKWGGDVTTDSYDGYTQSGQPNLRYEAGENQMVSGVFDPIKKLGYLSPASSVLINVPQGAISGGITDEPVSSLIDSTQERIYFFLDDGVILTAYGYTGDDFTDEVNTSFQQVNDSALYYKNGVRTVYVIGQYSIGTSSRIMEFAANADPSTINDNWSSADVTNAFVLYPGNSNKLITSGDGFMYVLNRNAVHRVDGTAVGGTEGTIYKDILKGPEDSYLTHGVEYNNYLYIVVHNNDSWNTSTQTQTLSGGAIKTNTPDCGVYVWNRQSTFYNSSNFIDLPGVVTVKSIWVSPKNELFLMVIYSTSEVGILKFNGSRFTEEESLPWGAHVSIESGLQVYGKFTYWCGSDGNIYRYGSEFGNEKDFLTIIGQYHNDGVGVSGPIAIAMVSSQSTLMYIPGNQKQNIDTMYIMGEYPSSTFNFKRFIPYAKNTIGFPN